MSRLSAKIRSSERGVALLMVLVMITMLGAVIFDFQFNSRVDLQLAYNARDQLQAEYNALSALKMRALLLKHSGKLKSALSGLAGGAGGDMAAMAGSQLAPMTQMLEMIPIECGLMNAVIRKGGGTFAELGEDEELSEEEALAQSVFKGECIATSESEHSKISINSLRNPATDTSGAAGAAGRGATTMLLGILSNPMYEKFFQEDDRNGNHAESPAELVGALIDWADADNTQELNRVSDEGRFYDRMPESYRVKNAPYDSLAEIQLVHGVSDDLYAVLKDNLSIYTEGSQIELGTTSTPRIIQALFGAIHPNVNPQELTCFEEYKGAACRGLAELYYKIDLARTLGMGMGFNVAMLSSLIQETGLTTWIDIARIAEIFTDNANTTWYTIEAQGRMGNATRKIRAVFQAVESRFYYVRIE